MNWKVWLFVGALTFAGTAVGCGDDAPSSSNDMAMDAGVEDEMDPMMEDVVEETTPMVSECGDSTVIDFNEDAQDGTLTGELDAADNLSGSCGGEDAGSDVVVRFTPESNGFFRFSTSNDYETVLYIMGDCTSGFTESSCNANDDGEANVVFEGTAGTPVYIIVDAGKGTDSRPFTLTGAEADANPPSISEGLLGLDPSSGGIGVRLSGTDSEDDIVGYTLTFKDGTGTEVAALETEIDNADLADVVSFTQGGGEFTFELLGFFDPSIAAATVSVDASFNDSTGLTSDVLALQVTPPTVQARGETCDLIFLGCDEADACVRDENGVGTCVEANAPELTSAEAFLNLETGFIGVVINGTDLEQNVVAVNILPLDANGDGINIGDPNAEAQGQNFAFDWLIEDSETSFTARAAAFPLRADRCLAGAQAVFDDCVEGGGDQNDCIDLANANYDECSIALASDIVAVRVSALDETNKLSEAIVVEMLAAPAGAEAGEVCDTQGATSVCPEGLFCFALEDNVAPTCGEPSAQCPEAWGAVNANDHPDGEGFSYTGDNSSGESRGAGSCGGGGPQEVIFFSAPEAGSWRFQTSSDAMNMVDPLIFAREFCAVASSELSCNDDIDTQGMNYDSTLTIELEEGQGVSVFIDSYSGQFAGPYTLNVSLQ